VNEKKVVNYIAEQLKAYGEIAGATKRAELEVYLVSKEFLETCEQVFQTVDADGSNSIDPNELAKAFQLVIENLPGVSEAVNRAMKKYSSSNTEVAAQKLAEKAFNLLDVDRSGSLEGNEFVNACRLMWCTALSWVENVSPGERHLTEAMNEYSAKFGPAAADELVKLFETFEFGNLCRTVFNQVDSDKNQTLDANEVLEACRIVAHELASTLSNESLRKEVVASFAADINAETVGEFLKLIDADGNGTLDEVEFTTAVKLLLIDLHTRAHRAEFGATDDYVESTLQRYANDLGPARVEFLRQLFARTEFPVECTMAFHRVDEDDSMALDKDELLRALRHILRTSGQVEKLANAGTDVAALQQALGSHLIDTIFEVVDLDGSGTIDAKEFPAVVKLFWIHVLRVDALGGVEAVKQLEEEERKKQAEAKSDESANLGLKRGSDESTTPSTNKRVALNETPAERAERLTGHDVIASAIQAKAAELEETKDASEGEAKATFDTKVKEVLELFRGADFQQACDNAFSQIDQDKSGTVERSEFSDAFDMLVSEVPNAKEKLKSVGVQSDEDYAAARRQLVDCVYEMLAVQESLDEEQFSLGLRLMWIQLAL